MGDATSGGPLTAANDSIRNAAKWLIASSAGVGVVLVAGSQLSSIGALETCVSPTQSCARLPVAVLAALVALGAVCYAVWRTVQLLLPVGVPIGDLSARWDAAEPEADVVFLKGNKEYLGFDSPAELEQAREQAWRAKRDADRGVAQAAAADLPSAKATAAVEQAEFDRLQSLVVRVTDIAQHERLKAQFADVLPHLLAAALVGALGILAFAWAANPPAAVAASADLSGADLSGADLRETDLSGTDLTDADLSGADLEGADLEDAALKDVVWSDTTCPDGTNSDDHDGTCTGHLDADGS